MSDRQDSLSAETITQLRAAGWSEKKIARAIARFRKRRKKQST